MVAETTQNCMSKKEGQKIKWVPRGPFNTPTHSRATMALLVLGTMILPGNTGTFLKLCEVSQLQSGLFIKPHETNKAHYWYPQPVGNTGPWAFIGPCTFSRVTWSQQQKQGSFVIPAQSVPASHPNCLMWFGWLPHLEQGEPDVTQKHTQS